jgi:uncharacterized membrane protein (DUF485 family)
LINFKKYVIINKKGVIGMKEEKLAMEMLAELKSNAKRWFIVSVIELLIILIITGIFVWYINQPIEQTTEETTTEYTQDADTQGDNSTINQNIGE